MRPRDDATLLGLYAREGDEEAFRELARRHGALVYGACLRHARSPELAEDAAQAVFLDLARKAGRVRVRTTLVPWLYAASRLAARNVLRAERRRPTVPLDESIPAAEVAADDALFQALDALGAPEREAVVLRFVQGLSLAEVGRAQGVSEDAARMRVSRALKRLRTEYVPALATPLSLSQRLATLALPKPVPLMTTPLLLATLATTAAIGSAATGALRHPAPPGGPPALARASHPAQASLPLSPAQEPAVQEPVIPARVHLLEDASPFLYAGPLTLAATIVERDLYDDARYRASVERIKASIRKGYPEGESKAASLKAWDEALKRPRPRVQIRHIEFMTDGRRLRLAKLPAAPAKPDPVEGIPQPIVLLYDGSATHSVQGGGRLVLTSRGADLPELIDVPSMGQGYPFRPLVERYAPTGKEKWAKDWPEGYRLAKALHGGFTMPPYATALVRTGEFAGGPVLTEILFGRGERKSETWRFSDHTAVGGRAFARRVVWTRYEVDPETGRTLAAQYETTVTLDRIEAKADPAALDLAKLVRPGAHSIKKPGSR